MEKVFICSLNGGGVRKIIQISACPPVYRDDGVITPGVIIALCNDSTVWMIRGSGGADWSEVKSIPQPEDPDLRIELSSSIT